jgi:hypothetical protein
VQPLSGDVAQLVEQRTENPCVGGSIPSITTFSIPVTEGIVGIPSFTSKINNFLFSLRFLIESSILPYLTKTIIFFMFVFWP